MISPRFLQAAKRSARHLPLIAALLSVAFGTALHHSEPAQAMEQARSSSGLDRAPDALQLAQMSDYQGDRIAAFESVVRDLTGRVEQLEHRLRQLEDRLEHLERRRESPAGTMQEAPGAYYEPPAEDSGSSRGPRVLGTTSDRFDQQQGAAAPEGASSGHRAGSRFQGEDDAASSDDPDVPESSSRSVLPDGDASAQYDHAFGLLRQANWDEAEAALKAFLDQHPDDRLSGNAQYWLGETYYVRGDYVSAARIFAEGFQDYPDSGKAPDNLLKLGMSLGMLDRKDDACGTFRELERRYDDAPAQILQRSRSERERLGC